MFFKNSISILSNNLSLVYKVLVFFFILLLICSAMFFVILKPITSELGDVIGIQELIGDADEKITDGNLDINSLINILNDVSSSFSKFVNENLGKLIITLLWLILLIMVFKFIISLLFIPISQILYEKMTVNFSGGFLYCIIASLKKSLQYALFSTLIVVPLDVICIALGIFFAVLFFNLFGFFGLTIGIGFILGVISVRMATTALWVPNIISGQSIILAFKNSTKKGLKVIFKTLPVYLTVNIVLFSVVISTAIITFGILPILIIPIYIVLLSSCNLVLFFITEKRKFYADALNVVDTSALTLKQ